MPNHKLPGNPPQCQPELRTIDPPSADADEDYREKCFEDLLLCVREIAPLAEKIVIDEGQLAMQHVGDAAAYVSVETVAQMLEAMVIHWQGL